MINKLKVIKDTIQKAFSDATIDYKEKKFELHKFRINREGRPPCWLYLTWEYIEDNDQQEILERLRKFNVLETFLDSPEPKWLAVGDFGVKEVDDTYGRGY